MLAQIRHSVETLLSENAEIIKNGLKIFFNELIFLNTNNQRNIQIDHDRINVLKH